MSVHPKRGLGQTLFIRRALGLAEMARPTALPACSQAWLSVKCSREPDVLLLGMVFVAGEQVLSPRQICMCTTKRDEDKTARQREE